MSGLPANTLRFRLADARLFASVLDRYRTGGEVGVARQPGSPAYDPVSKEAGR